LGDEKIIAVFMVSRMEGRGPRAEGLGKARTKATATENAETQRSRRSAAKSKSFECEGRKG